MTQIERIRLMESCLDEGEAAVKALEAALDLYERAQEKIRTLSGYYGSDEWSRDFDDDQKGRLPQDLKRGVLSEDAPWDLLTANRDLQVRMLELVARMIKK